MSVKSLAKKHIAYTDRLSPQEDPFSKNRVTGWSLNVPIIGTCSPTQVCGETCYFARGASTWTPSLKKQHRLKNSIMDDPEAVARRIAASALRKRMTFVRWNGGGDLFPEMVPCIDIAASLMPDVPQWVVSRKPSLASCIMPAPYVWIHVSIDKSSWPRLAEMRRLAPPDLQWFWSYQCDKGEQPPSGDVAPVIFRNCYDLLGTEPLDNDCPLNLVDDITGTCERCRRCFDGEATSRAVSCCTTSPRE